ncbi:HAD family hydrolase [Streptococcus ferus]|uniref:HAD family hydrolase n=2 Tax=Streptococcus ferus TaxID=1345 RepID=UPI00359FA51E
MSYESTLIEYFNVQSFDFVEEGLPLPVFYGSLFNREQNMPFEQQNDFYLVKTKITRDGNWVSEVNRSNGRDKFDFSCQSNIDKLNQRIEKLQSKLKFFLPSTPKNICFIGIPSSDADVCNLPQLIAKQMGGDDIKLIRTQSKPKTHLETRKRQTSFEEITKGLEITACNRLWWEEFDFIVVIDDITTTGSSFRMVNKFLIREGVPKEKIVNYAFYKYQSVENWRDIQQKIEQRTTLNQNIIDGVIWDFDETIVDSRERDTETENIIFNKERAKVTDFFNWYFYNKNCMYPVYSNLSQVFCELVNFNIPYAVVSNRYSLMSILFKQKRLREQVFPEQEKGSIRYYRTKVNGKHIDYENSDWLIENKKKTSGTSRYTKPSPETILKAVEKIKDISKGKRIVAIGNTKNDIIAYKAAGLETILVTWGIKYRFGRTYGADHIFETPLELLKFLKQNVRNNYILPPQNNGFLGIVAESEVDFNK